MSKKTARKAPVINQSTPPEAAADARPDVRVVNGKLILSLPHAEMPVVWQLDLDQAQANAFTIQEDEKKKCFTLISKETGGAVDEIAIFKNKDDAVAVLMETSKALQTVEAGPNEAAKTKAASGQKNVDVLGAVLALALVIVLIFIWSITTAGPRLGADGLALNTSGVSGTNPQDTSGVAVSADDFLNNR